jgi:hypothetical protein
MGDINTLLDRIDALERLLACYRLNRHPSEALFIRLERSRANVDELKRKAGL